MKKSLILVLSLPLLLASCDIKMGHQTTDQNPGEQTSQTGDQSGQGTEGSTSGGEGHSGGFHPGGGSHSGGDTTGGGTTGGETTGGGTETGGQTTGGGTETGGGTTETSNESVLKDVTEFGLSNGNKPSNINFNEDITLSCGVGENDYKNAPAFFTSDSSLRFYFGNTLTVSNSKGVITRIVLYYNSTNDDNLFSANVGIMSDYQTWNGSASSVTFKVEGDSGSIKLFRLKVDYSTSGGGTTGGGTTTGGGGNTTGGGTETGGGTVTGKDYTSTWPSQYQQYVVTYLNGMVPCFLDVNKKCLFNKYDTGTEETTGLPYFNPSIKNTSPGINYEYDYGGILSDAGFKQQENNQEDGVTWKVYTKGTIYVRFAKYKADDNIYYFDMYAFNDYFNTTTFAKAYTFQHDDKNLGLTSKYDQNNKTVSVNNWKITLTDIQKSSYYMQLKKDTGKIVIEGNVKGVYLEILRNSDAAFVKAGSSKSNAKYIFNNGYRFDFPEGTKYVEISAQSRVLEFEFFEIGY